MLAQGVIDYLKLCKYLITKNIDFASTCTNVTLIIGQNDYVLKYAPYECLFTNKKNIGRIKKFIDKFGSLFFYVYSDYHDVDSIPKDIEVCADVENLVIVVDDKKKIEIFKSLIGNDGKVIDVNNLLVFESHEITAGVAFHYDDFDEAINLLRKAKEHKVPMYLLDRVYSFDEVRQHYAAKIIEKVI